MNIPYSMTPTSISLTLGFVPKVIPSTHPNFTKIRDLLFKPDTTENDLRKLIDIKAAIETFKSENVKVVNGKLYYKGFHIHNALSDHILGFINRGQLDAAEPFKNFLERAQQNPDPRAATDLYDWVVASGLPITPDGCILAWKAVGNDYFSLHPGPRGKLRHQIGDVVSEPREECDADPNRTCSRGLHFCSAPYLRFYQGGGSRVLAVKVDPANVVAFPKDYHNEKGRACEYTVVGEIEDRSKVNEFYPQGRAVYGGYDDVKVKLTGPIRAGQKWKDRKGEVQEIQSAGQPHGMYPVRTMSGRVYTAEGRYLDDVTEHRLDLIERIS